MFALDRFIPIHLGRHAARTRPGRWPTRRRASPGRIEHVRIVLPALCAIGIAALAGWMLAGGGLPSTEAVFGQPNPAALGSSGSAAVHLDSAPSGAAVRIDGATRGKTPLDTWLSPGQHTLNLQHADALDDDQRLVVSETGAHLDVALWRRKPDVVPLRPVYPGASLVDARFLDDGQVALLVNLRAQPGAPNASRELWQLDPTTGQFSRVTVPGVNGPISTMVLAPDGEQVAYVTPGSSSAVTASRWPINGTTPAAPQKESQPESVWVAPLDGTEPRRRIFELPSAGVPVVSGSPERIVDVVWTPDGSRLIAITRQTGPPARSRVFLLNVAAAGEADTQSGTVELVLLPAEVLPGSAVPNPNGRWLALVTHAAPAPGGNDVLNLCIQELQPGGTFRDLADLGAAARPPGAAPIAWAPGTDERPDRLVFVAPAPAAATGGGGFFGVFGALRASAPPSGLFVANLEASGLQAVQPHRLGSSINTVGPVWRSEGVLYGLARQDDGTLALHSIDPTTGAVRDLGVRLPAGTGQGTGLAARWDVNHGSALLLSHPSNGAGDSASLQAWLVSFVSPSSTAGATH